MTIQEMLDDIEDKCRIYGIKQTWDRFDLLAWASGELNRLSGRIDHDVFYVNVDPIIYTVANNRTYDLPANFGVNFAPNATDTGGGFCCLIDNGTSRSPLTFQSATIFFSQDLNSGNASIPSTYTIVTGPGGRKQIWLSPKPDDAYEVSGLYKPTDWALTTMNDDSPVPANAAVIEYAVLKSINPKIWTADYLDALNSFYMELARGRKAKFVPDLSGNRYRNF
jgi:hypothetical protein